MCCLLLPSALPLGNLFLSAIYPSNQTLPSQICAQNMMLFVQLLNRFEGTVSQVFPITLNVQDFSLGQRSGTNYRRTDIFTNSTFHLNVVFLPLTGVCVSWVSQPAAEHQKMTLPTIRSLLRSHRKHMKLRTPLIHRI